MSPERYFATLTTEKQRAQSHTLMKACLLIHGIGGIPDELFLIKKTLETMAFYAHTITLPGHDTSVEDFRKTFFKDWYAFAEKEYLKLQRQYQSVAIVGFSLGSAITLKLAENHNPTAICPIAPPIYSLWQRALAQKNPKLLLMPLYQYIRPVIYKPRKQQSREFVPVKGYEGVTAIPQLLSLFKELPRIRENLGKITCPALFINDLHDTFTLPYECITVAREISSEHIEFKILHIQEKFTSHHMVTIHVETRDTVAATIADFLRRVVEP